MNSEIRKADRIFPKDFADYAVQLHTSDENFSGYLGNISETGLCAIMPASFQPEVNEVRACLKRDQVFGSVVRNI